jgi:hypothetical protein
LFCYTTVTFQVLNRSHKIIWYNLCFIFSTEDGGILLCRNIDAITRKEK